MPFGIDSFIDDSFAPIHSSLFTSEEHVKTITWFSAKGFTQLLCQHEIGFIHSKVADEFKRCPIRNANIDSRLSSSDALSQDSAIFNANCEH
jgi:hypothetical protein